MCQFFLFYWRSLALIGALLYSRSVYWKVENYIVYFDGKKIVRFMLFNSRCRCFFFLLSMMRMVIHLFVQSEMKAENLFRQMNFGTRMNCTRLILIFISLYCVFFGFSSSATAPFLIRSTYFLCCNAILRILLCQNIILFHYNLIHNSCGGKKKVKTKCEWFSDFLFCLCAGECARAPTCQIDTLSCHRIDEKVKVEITFRMSMVF